MSPPGKRGWGAGRRASPGGWPQATCKDTGRAAGNVDTPSSRCGRASCAPETGHAAGNERTARPQDGRGRAEAGAEAQRVRLKTEGARATYMDAPSRLLRASAQLRILAIVITDSGDRDHPVLT